MALLAVLWASAAGLIIGWVAKQYSKVEESPKKALIIVTVMLLWSTVIIFPVGLRIEALDIFLMVWGMVSVVLNRVVAPYKLFSMAFWREVSSLEKRKV